MKTLLVCLCILCLPLCLIGCGEEPYRTDLSCKAITDKITDTLTLPNGYAPFGEEHMRFYFEDIEDYADKSLVYSTLTEDINEIGVFRGNHREDVEKLRNVCQGYVDTLAEEQRAFIASYAPEEITKLDHAEVRVYGSYVIYTVLSPEDRDTAFDILESLLQE